MSLRLNLIAQVSAAVSAWKRPAPCLWRPVRNRLKLVPGVFNQSEAYCAVPCEEIGTTKVEAVMAIGSKCRRLHRLKCLIRGNVALDCGCVTEPVE
jgi:hypothetical protein